VVNDDHREGKNSETRERTKAFYFLLSPTTSIPTTYFECLKKIVNGGSNAPVTCDWIEFPVTNICIYSHPNFVSQFEVDANVTHLEDWMVKIRCNP